MTIWNQFVFGMHSSSICNNLAKQCLGLKITRSVQLRTSRFNFRQILPKKSIFTMTLFFSYIPLRRIIGRISTNCNPAGDAIKSLRAQTCFSSEDILFYVHFTYK